MKKRERTGVICVYPSGQSQQILAIELEDPLSRKRYWSLPGGALEPGETTAEGAIRETLEETGYEVKLTSDVFTNHYLFRWNGGVFDCTTHWYLAELVDETSVHEPQDVDDADYLLRSDWLGWPRCRELFLYTRGISEPLDHFLPVKVRRQAG